MLERLRRRRDARAGRWVVLATERDDVPGQARRQAVTYGTPGRAAWLARSLARWLAGRLAGAAPGAGAWVWERAALSTYLPISIYLYLPTYLSSRARGRGDPTAVLAARRFIKCLLPSGLSISSSTE